jgi:hypothetical protein
VDIALQAPALVGLRADDTSAARNQLGALRGDLIEAGAQLSGERDGAHRWP